MCDFGFVYVLSSKIGSVVFIEIPLQKPDALIYKHAHSPICVLNSHIYLWKTRSGNREINEVITSMHLAIGENDNYHWKK